MGCPSPGGPERALTSPPNMRGFTPPVTSRKVDAWHRNGAGGFINRGIPSPSGVRALRAQQPLGANVFRGQGRHAETARYRDCGPEQSRESLAGVFRSGPYAPERAEALAREVELEPHR
jgi:hypothetical protein